MSGKSKTYLGVFLILLSYVAVALCGMLTLPLDYLNKIYYVYIVCALLLGLVLLCVIRFDSITRFSLKLYSRLYFKNSPQLEPSGTAFNLTCAILSLLLVLIFFLTALPNLLAK